MNDVFLNILVALGFILIFVGMWVSISFIAGKVSGWQKLAVAYPDANPEQHGEKKKWLYIRFGKTRYNGATIFEALPQGLRIRPIWLFRVGQSPMVIPWNQISEPEEKTTEKWDYIYTHQFRIEKAIYPVICTSDTAEWIAQKKKEFYK